MNLIPKITNYIFLIILITCLFSAESLKSELRHARIELDYLSVKKDSLEKKIQYIESKVGEKVLAEYDEENAPVKKKRWYRWLWPFGKK